MKLFIVYLFATYLAGLTLAVYNSNYMILALVTVILALICFKKYKNIILTILILLTSVFGYMYYKTEYNSKGSIDEYLDEEIILEGNLLENRGKHYLYADKLINDNEVYKIKEKILIKDVDTSNKRVVIKGYLVLPFERRNVNQFDYRKYLKSKDIYYIIYSPEVIDSSDELPFFKELRANVQEFVEKRISSSLPKKSSEIALGILYGNKEDMHETTLENYTTTGVAHIFAISGLHFGIFYLSLSTIFYKLPKRQKLLLTLLCLWCLAFLTGMSVSSVRACTLISMIIFASYVKRQYNFLIAISFAGLIILLISPLEITNVGFQLSFVATTSIVLFYPMLYRFFNKKDKNNKVLRLICVTLSAQIGIGIIMIYHFNTFSIWSFLINVPIVFLVGYLLPLLLLLIFFYKVKLVAISINVIVSAMNSVAEISSKLPLSSVPLPTPKITYVIAYYLAVIIIAFRKAFSKKVIKILIVVCIIILISNPVYSFFYSETSVTFIDIGQGKAILISNIYGANVLIDTGVNTRNDYLIDYLLKLGIKDIDTLIITHPHSDHDGETIDLINNFKVKTLVKSTYNEKYEDLNTNLSIVKGGDIIKVGNLKFEVLMPIKDDYKEENNNSITLLTEINGKKLLFTGDIEHEIEEEIIKNYTKQDIYLLDSPHHGSKTSSSEEFLDYFTPDIAVIQCGVDNFYNHPHNEVIERYKDNNIKVYRTDNDGAISIHFGKFNTKIETILEN